MSNQTELPQRLPLPGADAVLYRDAVIDPVGCLDALTAEIPWKQEQITLFGQTRDMPRLTCWMGEAAYTYSGLTNDPLPWSPTVQRLRDAVAERTGERFNGVLLNMYRNGSDSMGWHADDEPELGQQPVIASVSLGAVRRFRFRAKPHHAADPYGIDLPDGSVLVMKGDTQANWQHAIPKTKRAIGPRVNLTFRWIAPA